MSREATAQPASARTNRAGPELLEVARSTGRRAHEAGRRGRLVRRALVAADVVGLVAAFATAQLAFGASGSLAPGLELGIFAATLPAWALLARAYGLYANDAERAYHS